jgi:serine/threonine protein kinase
MSTSPSLTEGIRSLDNALVPDQTTSADPIVDSLLGRQIGGYAMLQRIGRGTLGEVYLAEDPRTGTRVALKVLTPELSQKTTVLDRFFKEARVASQSDHDGVARTLDLFVHDKRAFVAMELLRGESLGAYVQRIGNLASDMPLLLGLGSAVASAVGAVHASGIIHRDLKPASIYLHATDATGSAVTVKILDFGIVRLSQEEGGPGQTTSAALVGMSSYLSPEQCRGDAAIDARSDIYPLGCILYEAACGRPPFIADGLGDLLTAHLSQPPEPLTKLVPGFSSALNSVILRLLAKKPADRPQTMADVARALRECARGMRVELGDGALRPGNPVVAAVAFDPGQRPALPRAEPAPAVPRTLIEPRAADATSGRTMLLDEPERRGSRQASVSGTMRIEEHEAHNERAGGRAERARPALETERPARPASRRRSKALALAGGLLLGVLATVVLSRDSTPEPPAALARDDADTVQIEIRGIPSNTKVTVDEQPETLPIRVRRGPELHRIVLNSPGRHDRTLEVDGTKDRVIELAMEMP